MTLALAAMAALMISLVVAVRPGAVRADGTISWGGNGADQLPCDNGAHWVLSPSDGINSATLHVGNNTYVMTQSGNGSWSADSAGSVPSDESQVWVEFTGTGDAKDHLQLSHCLGGSPSASASASQSASASASQSASASASQSASASASQSASASASQSASASASQSASASASQSPEGSVEAATPVPSASTPNTAFTAPASTSSGTLLAGLLLALSLIALAGLNVRTARRRR